MEAPPSPSSGSEDEFDDGNQHEIFPSDSEDLSLSESSDVAPLPKIPRLGENSPVSDDQQQLLQACEIGDVKAVSQILAKLPEKNSAATAGPSLLRYRLRQQKSPIAVAIKNGHLDVVKLLRSLQPDKPVLEGWMMRAIKYGHVHIVEYLLNEGSFTHEGLVSACVRFSQAAVLQLLLSKGIKLQKPDEDPLLVAPAWLGDYEMCKLLVEQRAGLRESTKIEGNTPLLQAVTRGASGNEAIVELFLEHGADVNHVNRFGYTAFELADENCFTRIGLRLFESGAKVNAFESSEAIFISRPYIPPPAPIIPSATGCVVRSDGIWMCGRIPGTRALPNEDETSDSESDELGESKVQNFDLWRLEKETQPMYLGTPLVLEGGPDVPLPPASFACLGNYLEADPTNPLIVRKIAKSMVASLMRVGTAIDFSAGPLSYFELEVLSGGGVSAIAIGVVPADYDTTRLPGWQPISFAYHGDNGYRFASVETADSQGHPYGPPAKVGDVMGCGVIHSTAEVFFTHNGRFLGVVGTLPVPPSSSSTSPVVAPRKPSRQFHFAVGLRSVGEKILANFGQRPFRFNFEVDSMRFHRGKMSRQCALKIRRLQALSATWLVRASAKLCVKSIGEEEGKKSSTTLSSVSVVATEDKKDADGVLCILATFGLVVFEPTRSFCEWRDYVNGPPTSDRNPFFRILQLDEGHALGFAVESGFNLVYILDLSDLRWNYFAVGGTVPSFGVDDDLMDTVNAVNGKVYMLSAQRTARTFESEDDEITERRRQKNSPSYMYILDVESRLWERVPLPNTIARDHLEGTLVPSSSLRQSTSAPPRMIYFGGWDRHNHSNAIQILELGQMRWQRVHTYGYASMKPRSQVNICAIDKNKVIVVGGWDGMQAASDIDLIEFKPMSSLKHPLATAFDCDDNLADITVVVGSRRVPLLKVSSGAVASNAESRVRVHRVVLCSRSAFFRSRLLEQHQSEVAAGTSSTNANREFVWEGPSARAGRLLLEFLYTDVMESVRIEDAPEVLHWAKTLFPEHLTRITEFVIMTRIGVNSTMNSDLQWALNDRTFTDITFDVMGTSMKYHKVMLTTLSDYFRALLRGHFRESRSEVIQRPDVDPTVFEMLIQFLYTRRVEITGEYALPLLALANRYNVRELRDVTEDSLAASVTLENCCFLLAAADLESCSRLKKVCLDFACRHFGAQVATKAAGFTDLSDVLQKELLRHCV